MQVPWFSVRHLHGNLFRIYGRTGGRSAEEQASSVDGVLEASAGCIAVLEELSSCSNYAAIVVVVVVVVARRAGNFCKVRYCVKFSFLSIDLLSTSIVPAYQRNYFQVLEFVEERNPKEDSNYISSKLVVIIRSEKRFFFVFVSRNIEFLFYLACCSCLRFCTDDRYRIFCFNFHFRTFSPEVCSSSAAVKLFHMMGIRYGFRMFSSSSFPNCQTHDAGRSAVL